MSEPQPVSRHALTFIFFRVQLSYPDHHSANRREPLGFSGTGLWNYWISGLRICHSRVDALCVDGGLGSDGIERTFAERHHVKTSRSV